jgi:MFS family permease
MHVSAEHGISEWQRGGPCLASAIVGYAAGFGVFMFTASLFIDPMRSEFGWTTSQATFQPISLLVLAILLPLAGRLSERLGPRLLVMVGLAGFAACFLMLALLPLSVTVVRIVAVALGICCAAAGTVPFGRAVVSWFRRNAGFAIGLAGSGSTLGGVVGVPLCAIMIDQLGWRMAYVGLACIVLLIGLPLVYFFLRPSDEDRNQGRNTESRTEIGEVTASLPIGDVRFWVLIIALTCSGLSIGLFLNHLRPILAEAKFSLTAIALLGSSFSVATFVGRIVAGFLIDRALPVLVATGCLTSGMLGTLLLALQATPSIPLTALALILVGLAYGAEADFAAFFTLRFFGLTRFSVTFGTMVMMIALALAAGGYAAASSVDIYGTYRPAVVLAPVGFGLAAILMLCVGQLGKASRFAEPSIAIRPTGAG